VERGVRERGDWSMSSTPFNSSMPESSAGAGSSSMVMPKWRARLLKMMGWARVDFPEPETPVRQTKMPRGRSRESFLMLLAEAREIFKWDFGLRCFVGVAIVFWPER